MIAPSDCSRPRWPIQACYRRRGHVPGVAGIQPLPTSCAGARLPSRPALAPAGAGRRLAVLPVRTGARSLSWMSRGACRQADPELFFPITAVTGQAARQVEAAKAVCGPCAVRANCLSYAFEAMPQGIWAEPPRRSAAQHGELTCAGPGTPQHSGSRPAGLHGELVIQPAALPACPAALTRCHGPRHPKTRSIRVLLRTQAAVPTRYSRRQLQGPEF